MSTDIGRHVPTSAFRATMEQQISRAFRTTEIADMPPSTRRTRPSWRTRLRNVALVTIGLLLGVGAQFASAQVQDARQRSELEAAKHAERDLLTLRLQMAELNLQGASKASEVGAGSREAVRDAELEVQQVRVAIAILELELLEIRATAASPRDELWTPLNGSRDFVRERLQMQALVAQQRLAVAESEAREMERSHAAGAVLVSAVRDAQLDMAQAKMEFERLVLRIQLRDRFLKDGLSAEQVTRELQRVDLTVEIRHAQERLKAAEERLRSARERSAVGVTTALELKRAELEVLEVQLEMQRMGARFRALPPEERRP